MFELSVPDLYNIVVFHILRVYLWSVLSLCNALIIDYCDKTEELYLDLSRILIHFLDSQTDQPLRNQSLFLQWELDNSEELDYRNSAQTGKLIRLFSIFADLVNRVRMRQNTDWLVPNSLFSPTESISQVNNVHKVMELHEDVPKQSSF